MDYVEGSAKDVRTRALNALEHGEAMSVILMSGRTSSAASSEVRTRTRTNELQVKLISDDFSVIVRIPYDDDRQVTAETYTFRYTGLIPSE